MYSCDFVCFLFKYIYMVDMVVHKEKKAADRW